MDGHIIRILQIVKWFYFLSPLRGFVMVVVHKHRGTALLTPAYYLLALSGLKITNVRVIFLQLTTNKCSSPQGKVLGLAF